MESITLNKESLLSDDAKESPMDVLSNVFDISSRDSFRQNLRMWLCRTLTPGKFYYRQEYEQVRLTFFHDQLLLVIDALFFIMEDGDSDAQFLQEFKKKFTGYSLPAAINSETNEPAAVLAAFFRLFRIEYVRAELWDWLRSALINSANNLTVNDAEDITRMYEESLTLVEAAYTLHTRNFSAKQRPSDGQG